MRFSMAVVLAFSISLASQAKDKAKKHHKGKAAEAIAAADLKWHDVPQAKGVQIAVAWGDAMKGAHGVFAKFAPDTHHPLHTHPNTVRAVILSGTFLFAEEGQEAKEYGPGSYLMLPGGHRHTSGCKAGAECVIFQTGSARFATKPVGDPLHAEGKHEAAKHEEPKHHEEARHQEEARHEEEKHKEQLKHHEEPKHEEAKHEEPKHEEPKQEEPKQEEPKPEAPKP